jgi:GGDEF domain-containing protein
MRRTILSLTPPLREALRGPQLAVFLLALALALLWFGSGALLLALPFAFIALVPRGLGTSRGRQGPDPAQRAEMTAALGRSLERARSEGRTVLCILIGIDGFAALRARHGRHAEARIVTSCLDDLSRGLRPQDALFDLGEGRFGIVLLADGPLPHEAGDGITQRLRTTLQDTVAATLPKETVRICAGFHIPDPAKAAAPGSLVDEGLRALGAQMTAGP